MKRDVLKTDVTLLAAAISLLLLSPQLSLACTAKSGKDCSHTVAHKTDHKAKLQKRVTPAANLGAVAKVGKLRPLGVQPTPVDSVHIPQSAYVPTVVYMFNGKELTFDQEMQLKSNPRMMDDHGTLSPAGLAAGYTRYVRPRLVITPPQHLTGVVYDYYATVNGQPRLLTDAQVERMRGNLIITPDGNFIDNDNARAHGYFQVLRQPAPPTPQQAAVPNLAPQQMAVPGLAQPAQAPAQPSLIGDMVTFYYQMSPDKSQKQAKPGHHQEIVGSYTRQQMQDMGLINPNGTLKLQAHAQGFNVARTPAPYVQYYRTVNGQQVLLTPQQVENQMHSGAILIDGSLSQQAKDHGYSMVVNTQPNLPQQQVVAQNPQAPAQTFTGGTPDGWFYQVPQRPGFPVAIWSYHAITHADLPLVNPDGSLTARAISRGYVRLPPVPTAQQVAVPNLAPQLVATPSYAVPGRAPAPQQVAVPNMVPQHFTTPQLAPGVTPAQPTVMGHLAVRYEQRGIDKNQKLHKNKGHDTHTVTGSFTLQQMIDKGYATPSGQLTTAGAKNGITRVSTPLPGVQYFHRRPNGQLVPLTPTQTHQLITSGTGAANVLTGELTQQGINQGFAVVVQSQPNLAPQQVVAPGYAVPDHTPTPTYAAVPNMVPQQMVVPPHLVPGLVPAQPTVLGHASVLYYQNAIAKPDKLKKTGHTVNAHTPIASYTLQQMISMGLATPNGVITVAAAQQGFVVHSTPLPGVQYYIRKPNGQQVLLTPSQVGQMHLSTAIKPDGTLSQRGVDSGLKMVINRQPNLAPQQVATPGYAVPDRTPTPDQVAVPNLAPQQMVVPNRQAPGYAPTPNQVNAPNLAPQQVATPGYATPDRTPTPNQVNAPNLAPQQVATPGYATPDRTPTPNQVNAPNLAPQQVATPGYAVPDQIPVAQPGMQPGQVPQPLNASYSTSAMNTASEQHPEIPGCNNQVVEVYTADSGRWLHCDDAKQPIDNSFNFVVVGFKEAE